MKKSILILAAALAVSACNQTDKKVKLNPVEEKVAPFNHNPIIRGYLAIEKALINDDAQLAADSAKSLATAIESFDDKSLNAKESYVFLKIKDDALEHATHISENADHIDHQREHFKMLSENIYDYVKVAGSSQPLYKINCPMYKEGSFWLSATREVENPFYGEKMSSCGSVEETLK